MLLLLLLLLPLPLPLDAEQAHLDPQQHLKVGRHGEWAQDALKVRRTRYTLQLNQSLGQELNLHMAGGSYRGIVSERARSPVHAYTVGLDGALNSKITTGGAARWLQSMACDHPVGLNCTV